MPYTLPNGWCWCKLGDLCSFESGFAFSSNDFKTSGIPLVRISNIQDSTVTLKNCVFIQDEVDEKYIIKTGDLLIAMSGATTGKMGIYSMRQRALLNQRVGNICVQSRYLTANYRNYFMYSQSDVILKMAYGGAQPNISSQMILNIPIPLPPLSEQYRIVNAIKNLLEIVDRIEENQISLDKFLCSIKQKILQLALSGNLLTHDHNDEPAIDLLRRINPSYIPCDNRHYENKPFSIPDSWVWVMGKDLFLPMKNCKPSGEYFKYIDIDSIDNQNCVIKCPKVLPVTAAPSRATRYTQVGDILFSMVRPYLKNIAIVTEGNCIASTGFYVCSPNEALFSKYCYYLMISPYVINGLTRFMKGDNSPSINNARISEWLYPLPPLNEQKRIVQKIDEIFNYLDSIVAEL